MTSSSMWKKCRTVSQHHLLQAVCITQLPISVYTKMHVAVYTSFMAYVAVEKLDGENKYNAGNHGLQVCG